MIEPSKLFQLSGGQKRRKLALTFGALERDIAGIAEKGTEYSFKNMPRAEYTRKITEILLQDPKLDKAASDELRCLLDEKPFNELRVCNCARNHLLALIGTFPAEWDLVIAPHEIAHAFQHQLYPNDYHHHSKHWKTLCQEMGGTGDRYHYFED